MYQDDVRIGECTYLANAAIAEGLCLIQTTTAKTVGVPTAGLVPLYVASSVATAADESIQVVPIEPGREIRVRANGTITAGDLCEITLSGADAGKVVTLSTGAPRFVALQGAVDEDLFLVRALTTSGRSLGQPTPVAQNATATLAAGDILAGIITSTGTTGPSVLTTRTGTQLTAELTHVPVGGAHDFTIINTGTGASTDVELVGGTDVTIVGNYKVGSLTDGTTISGSGLFRAKRSTATVWIIYRIA